MVSPHHISKHVNANRGTDDRVKAGVAVIGCPTFPALMIPRAEEKREERLPQAFLDLVAKLDPKLDIVSKKEGE
jgi:hypothetical protein